MSLIKKMLKYGSAVWWPLDPQGPDVNGRPRYLAPQQLTKDTVNQGVRWEDIQVEFINAQGEQVLSRARVYVGIDLQVGDVLRLGKLADLVDTTDPKRNPGAFEVRSFEKLPNLRSTEYLRTALL